MDEKAADRRIMNLGEGPAFRRGGETAQSPGAPEWAHVLNVEKPSHPIEAGGLGMSHLVKRIDANVRKRIPYLRPGPSPSDGALYAADPIHNMHSPRSCALPIFDDPQK
jgi:hypothetical protein